MMVDHPIACRTCGVRASRIDEVHAGFVAACSSCADRTNVRCPRCRKQLSRLRERYARCKCGHTFRIEPGGLVDVRSVEEDLAERAALPMAAPKIEEPLFEPKAPPQRSTGTVKFDEQKTVKQAAFRDAPFPEVLDVERRGYSRRIPARLSSRVRFTMAAIAAAPVIATLLAGMFDAGLALGVLACFGIPIFAAIAAAAQLLGNEREEVPPKRVRIGPQSIERSTGDAWVSIARTEAVRDVARERTRDGKYCVRVALQSGDAELLDALDEDEAIEVEHRVTAHIGRLRAK